MNKKFVLESFQAYLDIELNPINEARGGSEITEESVATSRIVQKILEKQKELAAKNIRFKKYTNQADPYEAWKAAEGEEAPTGEGELKFTSAFAAPYLYDKLTDDQRNDLNKEIAETLNNYGYKKIKEIEKLIEEKTTLISPPVIYIVTAKTKIPGPLVPVEGKPEEYELVKEEDEHGIFKDNEWELKDSSFSSPETKAKLVDPIKEFVSGFASGNIKNIEYIVIQASANRYRNTGISENISWGELSFNRSKTIAGIFKAAADEFNLTEEQRTLLQSKISIDYGGSNGDGTSGPNPMDPIAFGYYNETGKFIQNNGSFDKKRSTVVIDKLNEEGKPTGEITTKTIEPDADKAAYEKYKYVNVVIKATVNDSYPTEEWIPTEIENVEYKPGFKMPRKGVPSKGSGRYSSRRKIIGKPGKGPSRRGCPLDFK